MEIELPDAIPYPKFLPVQELKGQYCHIFKSYSLTGVSLIIARNAEVMTLRLGDFEGKLINPDKKHPLAECAMLALGYSKTIVEMLKLIGIPKATFYFSSDLRLVDVMLSLNKYCSPGYLKDFFGKQNIPIQESI